MNKVTTSEYVKMPKVEIDGKLFVDKQLFVGHAINLLQQDMDDAFCQDERYGFETAIKRLQNI